MTAGNRDYYSTVAISGRKSANFTREENQQRSQSPLRTKILRRNRSGIRSLGRLPRDSDRLSQSNRHVTGCCGVV